MTATKMLRNEWRAFRRAKAFQTNIWLKILMGFGALYFIVIFAFLGTVSYFIIEDMELGDPLKVVNGFMIYLLAFDIVFRFFLQKMPVDNIKPLLYLPLTKGYIVRYSLFKTVLSFFNIVYAFFFLPFSIVLIVEGYDPMGVIGWHLAIFSLILLNNFLNIFSNTLDVVFYPLALVIIIFGFLQYQGIYDITAAAQPVFTAFYEQPYLCLIPLVMMVAAFYTAVAYYKKKMYLDAGLAKKAEEFKEENLSFLDRFGDLAPYIKNDVKLIRRNKRARMTLVMAVLFVFYGLAGQLEVYEGLWFTVFAGLFCTGGFLFSFGGFVPSWDSSYYKLMMSQNIPYRKYLLSKWYLMVAATLLATVLTTFYIFIDVNMYLAMLAGAVYNIGFNSAVVLWGGAYVKTPIDLQSSKQAFGGSKAFNVKTLLITIPKIILPLLVFWAGYELYGPTLGFGLVALTGILGLLFRNKLFDIIERTYKQEKYDTIAAYAEKN